MYAVYCPTHESQVLLGSRSIMQIENTAHGIDLHWQCHCGTRGVEHLGERSASAVDTPVAA